METTGVRDRREGLVCVPSEVTLLEEVPIGMGTETDIPCDRHDTTRL